VSRDMTQAAKDAVKAKHVPFAVFVEMDFPAGVERLCNAAYDFEWDGKTWKGLGHMGKLSPIRETADGEAAGVALELSGIPQDRISTVLGEYYQGRPVKIWFAPLDPDDYSIIAEPSLEFVGRMDVPDIEMGKKCIIRMAVENRMIAWNTPSGERYNGADQKRMYPDDTGLDFVEDSVDKEIIWGMM